MLVIGVHPERGVIIRVRAEARSLPSKRGVRLCGRLNDGEVVGSEKSANEPRGIFVATTAQDSHRHKRFAAEHLREMLRQELIGNTSNAETSGAMT